MYGTYKHAHAYTHIYKHSTIHTHTHTHTNMYTYAHTMVLSGNDYHKDNLLDITEAVRAHTTLTHTISNLVCGTTIK